MLAACRPDVSAPQLDAGSSGSVTASASAIVADTSQASATPSSIPSAVPTLTEKQIEPIVPDKSGLRGKTVDFTYDASELKDRSRAYEGRIFLHEKALKALGPVPLVVFIHGLNRALIPHRWVGGGDEGDVRRILSELMEAGKIPPVILAAPGSIQKDAVSFGASFPAFDYDKFIELVKANLKGAEIDDTRVIVTGHSGAGCSDKGGIIAALNAKAAPLAVISIDTCMAGPLASALGAAPPDMNVIVTWQTATWERNFDHFKKVFAAEKDKHPPSKDILRELDHLPSLPRSHDATVKQTFDKWLPRLLPTG